MLKSLRQRQHSQRRRRRRQASAKAEEEEEASEGLWERVAHAGRQRQNRPYPASTFKDAVPLGEAIMRFASGDKVRRLTLLQQMDKSPNSSATKMLITNSGKYGIAEDPYAAEFLEAYCPWATGGRSSDSTAFATTG